MTPRILTDPAGSRSGIPPGQPHMRMEAAAFTACLRGHAARQDWRPAAAYPPGCFPCCADADLGEAKSVFWLGRWASLPADGEADSDETS